MATTVLHANPPVTAVSSRNTLRIGPCMHSRDLPGERTGTAAGVTGFLRALRKLLKRDLRPIGLARDFPVLQSVISRQVGTHVIPYYRD